MKPHDNISKLSDSEILHLYVDSHDTSLIGELYRRYSHLVFGVCLKYLRNKEDARDALLAVFEKLITDLQRYEITGFQNWIYAVSKHHCLNKLKEKERYNSVEVDEFKMQQELPNDHSGELSDFQKKELMLTNLESAIHELCIEQKTCVTLFYLKKMSYREISQQTRMTMNEIKSHIQNGRRNLALLLRQQS